MRHCRYPKECYPVNTNLNTYISSASKFGKLFFVTKWASPSTCLCVLLNSSFPRNISISITIISLVLFNNTKLRTWPMLLLFCNYLSLTVLFHSWKGKTWYCFFFHFFFSLIHLGGGHVKWFGELCHVLCHFRIALWKIQLYMRLFL